MTLRIRVFIVPFLLVPLLAHADSNPLSSQHQKDLFSEFVQKVKNLLPGGTAPSKWSDAKSWKPVGNRFAAAYDQNQKLIAVYDLSYPEVLNPVPLAEIGSPRISPDAIVSLWRIAKTNKRYLPKTQASAIDALKPEALLKNGVPSEESWRSLPWAKPRVSAPDSFRLSDLDPGQVRLSPDLFAGLRQLFGIVLDDSEGVQALGDQELMGSFQFIRSPEGAYRIFWSDPRHSRNAVSRPRKLLDLRSPKNGLDRNIEFETAIFALSEATSLIPVPLVQALVSTAISRLGRYYDMTQVEHLEMLRELVVEAGEDSLIDPELGSLSSADLETVRNAFVWGRVSPAEFWDWLFTHPDDSWNTDLKQASDCENRSGTWFASQNDGVEALNPRFSIATAPRGDRSLYIDSFCGSAGPALSIHYANPSATASQRAFVEAEGVSFEFATYLIPTVGFAVREAYTLLVQDSIDTLQYWEARLTQHLEVRPDSAAWKNELSILQNQRTNPLELNRDKMEALIAKRRAALGL